ncbi:MAG TPA: ATP-binding protein [Pyrinomonadaceae bacterium]|jgi:anti-sigma regulatory factor (Ser/Thr protein kinase)|nr:ATP-binding protein [Pyrinomonadaceae bacterium]
MREIKSVEIRDEAQVGTARRAVHSYASDLEFSEVELAEIDIVVQEIGTNAARYASAGGWLHFTSTPSTGAEGLELFYWDTGPGIYNMDRAIRDGVSTSGSLGAGLGAISRLMDEFDVYSTMRLTGRLAAPQRRTSHGTVLLARKWTSNGKQAADAADLAQRIGVWSRPHPDEDLNGDAYFMRQRGGRTLFAVIDGLGHGPGAKEAADVAMLTLDDWMGEPLDDVMTAAHNALRATRGAVMGAAIIDYKNERFHYASVGNISARVFGTPEHVSLISTNGMLGGRLGKLRVWTYGWASGATLVMTSDGLSENWDINSYPGLLGRSPQLLAGILMRDYARQADDATVLVVR